jgi:two-component system response regulator NreC
MSAKIRIVIVDDHAVVRSGLRALLEKEADLEVVGEAGDAQHAVFEMRAQKPDVMLIDVTMPGVNGITATANILKERPETKVLMLSMEDDPSYVRGAFAAGALGYVLKEAADTELVQAIHVVAAGDSYVNPSLGAKLVSDENRLQREAAADPLSEREHEVLQMLALGHTNQEISDQLYLSVRTVETHRAHIMRKLHLKSRAELVRYAMEHDLMGSE